MTPALSSHCSSPEAGFSSLLQCPSSLPQHQHPPSEACLRRMLSEEDRVYQEDSCYRNHRRRPSSSSSSSENASLGHLTVWRERVAQWVYTVIDHVDADRSVVYNVLLLLDAYLDAILSSSGMPSSSHNSASHAAADANPIDAIDAATYQLLAMSCLYLVLRLRDNGAHSLSVEQLVSMSRNDASSSSSSTGTAEANNAVVTPARIARTMKSIVQTLEASWRTMVYAPSPGEFVVAYVEQMQHSDATNANGTNGSNANTTSTSTSKIDDLLHASKWSSVLDDAAYLAELSVCDTYLRYDRPSVIAYAALLNVLNCHESFADKEEEGSTLKQDLQSLQRVTGCVTVSRTTVKSIYSRLGYVQSQSLDAAMAPTSYSHHDRQGEEEEAATAVVVPQDDDDEVEVQQEEEEEVAAVAPTAAAIVSAATSPSPSTPSTTSTTTTRGGGVKRRISAVVSCDDVSAVVDAALPPAGNAADTSTESSSDSEEEEGFPMSSSSSSSSSSGMKRVRSYSSDLSSFADPDEASKRMRLVESRQ